MGLAPIIYGCTISSGLTVRYYTLGKFTNGDGEAEGDWLVKSG